MHNLRKGDKMELKKLKLEIESIIDFKNSFKHAEDIFRIICSIISKIDIKITYYSKKYPKQIKQLKIMQKKLNNILKTY